MSDNILTLYHGSVYSFDKIDLNMGKEFKDFGKGFYTTQNRDHAINLAKRNHKILLKRQQENETNGDVFMWLYTYEFPIVAMENLSVKKFIEPTSEWIKFVGANRTHKRAQHCFDIVMGPTANDRTNLSFKTYFYGGFGKIGSQEAIDILLRLIKPNKLSHQIFFGSRTAVKNLIFKSKEIIP
jgi:hypothetical protein